MAKALALFSGGLDSILAVKVVQEQGIEVVGISYTSPFFSADDAKKAADAIDIPLHLIDISNELLEIIRKPKYGHGRHMNPCIDCHSLMIRKAGYLLKEMGASFIVTGEVLGERPKSQNANALRIVEKESQMEGYLLRPLSAKLLKPTVPENEGVVNREGLLAISGRSRKSQMELARRFGIREFPTPAGGCLLTDEKYSLRLKDLLSQNQNPTQNDLSLLRWGRQFRSSEGAKIVVSRSQDENQELLELLLPGDLMFQLTDYPGPTVLVRGAEVGQKTLREAAALTTRYSKARNFDEVSVEYGSGDEEKSGKILVNNAQAAIDSNEFGVSFIDEGRFKKNGMQNNQ